MAKRQDKSSKTAHVLNLITSPAAKQAAAQKAAEEAEAENPQVDEEISADAAEAAELNQQAAQVRQPLIPPILQVANRHDETLAEQINEALIQEFAAEQEEAEAAAPSARPQPPIPPAPVSQPAPAPQPAAAPEPEPIVQSAPAPQAPPAPQPEVPPMPQPAPVPPAQPEEPARFNLSSAIVSSFTIPEPPPLPPLQEELQFVNVMQKLVETMAPRYIEKFGVCSCARCLEDVKALALTNLGPKYTVFPASERIPMLTIYERRYSSLVATELTKACTVVKANPRHS